jgi:hypothetical protein
VGRATTPVATGPPAAGRAGTKKERQALPPGALH